MFDHTTTPAQHYEWMSPLPLAQIIRIPPGGQKDPSYSKLICTEEDKALISELISTLSESSKFSLLMKQSHLRQLGAQINHVHPFKFLGAIFSNPRLKIGMRNVFDDYFKRSGFMEGLGPSLTREASKNKLIQYLDEFAAEVNVDKNQLRSLFGNKNWSGSDWVTEDWEKLVRFLIDHD